MTTQNFTTFLMCPTSAADALGGTPSACDVAGGHIKKSAGWVHVFDALSVGLFEILSRPDLAPADHGEEACDGELNDELALGMGKSLEGVVQAASDAADEKREGDEVLHGGAPSGGFGLGLHAQDIPCDIGAKVFATHTGLAFDDGAEFGGDGAITAKQLAHELGASVNGSRECRPASLGIDRAFDGFVHADTLKQCWTSCQALVDQKLGPENPAMLDRNSTTEKLKASLSAAYAGWSARDPKNNTKAQLARLCSQAADADCSPQTVGSWFKTGRMDKSWLPIVERILGASLGFGLSGSAHTRSSAATALKTNQQPVAARPSQEIARALELLSEAIGLIDESTRKPLEPLISLWAKHGDEDGLIAQSISFSLGKARIAANATQDQKLKEGVTTDFMPSGNNNGQRDTTEQEQELGRGVRGIPGGDTGSR